jgi:predicted MPP superfamily phosphohydrolase
LETQENVLPFFRACADLAPSFLSLGNHEQMLDAVDLERIRSTGVVVLDNSWTEWNGVVVAGLTSGYVTDYRRFRATQDGAERYPKKGDLSGIGGAVTASQHRPETAWLSDFAAQPGYHILLSHQPEYFPLVPDAVDLVLSGHAHGGQVRLFNPFKWEWTGLWSPGQGFWAKWTRGVYERNRLVVSAGLSNTAWVPRLFNPTEVVFIEPE